MPQNDVNSSVCIQEDRFLNLNQTTIIKVGVYKGWYTDLLNEFSRVDNKSKRKLPIMFGEKNRYSPN